MIMNKAYFYGWHLRSCSLEVKVLIVTTGQEPQLNLAHPILLTMADQLIEHTISNLILIGFITSDRWFYWKEHWSIFLLGYVFFLIP